MEDTRSQCGPDVVGIGAWTVEEGRVGKVWPLSYYYLGLCRSIEGNPGWVMDISGLLCDLARLDRMLWVIGSGDVVSENTAVRALEPEFTDGYVNLEADQWHIHLNVDSVKGVQFVEAEDSGIPYLYYVRFSDATEGTIFRVYFPNPYLDDHDEPAVFQPEKLKVFERVRDQYVGLEGIIFAKRMKQ